MKKYIILIFNVFSFSTFAQNILPNSGNVGIGTTAPSSLLHLEGGNMFIAHPNNPSVNFGHTGSSIWSSIYRESSSGKFILKNHQGLGISFMGGYVGIGLLNPESQLHIKGGGPMTHGWNKTTTLEATYPVLSFNSNNSKWAGIGYDFSSNLNIWVNASSEDITGSGTNAISIKQNGLVGIGTNDAQTKLDVNSSISGDLGGQISISNMSVPLASNSTALNFKSSSNFSPGYNSARIKNTILNDGSNFSRLDFDVYDGALAEGTTKMSILNNGNVGIGTNSPSSILEIFENGSGYWSNINSSYTGSPTTLTLTNSKPGGYDPVLLFKQSTVDGIIEESGAIGLVGRANWAAGNLAAQVSDMYFLVRNNADQLTERMRIDYNGNVGIGTSSPAAQFHMKSPATATHIIEGDGNGYGNAFTLYKANNGSNVRALGMFMYDTGGETEWFVGRGYPNSDAFVIQRKGDMLNHSTEVAGIISGTGGSTGVARMFTINNSGNVGIGTSTPTEKLSVNGNIISDNGNTGLAIRNDDYNGGRSYLAIDGNINNGIASGSDYMLIERYANGEASISNSGTDLNLKTYGIFDITIKPNNTLSTVFKSNGKVGIGTSTIPDDYLLAVDGKIITEKVVVRNSSNWPDFVFAKNYNLPKLSEVEAFISSNNLLPELPSAKEIETNGQDLGEMNRLLLKKVEELTLYLIEQSKEVAKVKLLEKRIQVLETTNAN